MSWLSRLLSPSKRRVDESSLPPKKRARSLEDELTADKAPSTEYPYDEAELIQYSAKDSSKALGSLLLSSLIPRPLTLVASLDHAKNLTISPSSFCTVVSEDPAYISIGLSKDSLPPDSLTDAVSSVIDSREFTVNIVSEWLIGAVTKIAGSYEHIKPKLEVDLAESGITTSPSKLVSVPRLAQAAVSLECRMKNKVSIKDKEGEVTSIVVIAEVVCILANQEVIDGPASTSTQATLVNTSKLKPVAVVGGEAAGRVSHIYPLPLAPLESVDDEPPLVTLDAGVPSVSPAPAEGESGGLVGEEVAVAVATAVADSLATEPDAPSVDEVHVVMKDREDPPALSTRSTRSATAKSREATPISVIVH